MIWQKGMLSSVFAVLAYMLGGWDTLSQAMIACIALDVIAGVLRAGYEKRLNSSCMRNGLFRKAGYFLAVLLSVLLDRSLFHSAPASRTLVVSYIIVNESLSVLEHLAVLGVPLPRQFKQMLLKLRDRDGDGGGRLNG